MSKTLHHPALVSHFRPGSAENESFKILRTNLQYIALNDHLKTLILTSTSPGEGKSTIAGNLAVSLSQIGKKVLLIDADLRAPVQQHVFGTDCQNGLADLLAEGISWNEVITATPVPNLWLMPSGAIPTTPAELLGNGKLGTLIKELESFYDFIILDCPPVLPVTDTILIAAQTQNVILVVRAGATMLSRLSEVKKQLNLANARILGVILNNVYRSKEEHRYYHSYAARRI